MAMDKYTGEFILRAATGQSLLRAEAHGDLVKARRDRRREAVAATWWMAERYPSTGLAVKRRHRSHTISNDAKVKHFF